MALAQFFEASRHSGWLRFGQCANAYVELALHEQRHSSAATLLGYARAAGWGTDVQRRCAELLAELEAVLDAETLERLLAKGEALDEEAVCALTLETSGCGRTALRCAQLFSPLKGRFRAPICATCRTAVGRKRTTESVFLIAASDAGTRLKSVSQP